MRSWILFCLIPIALCVAVSPSPANVTISNDATANMACSGGVCSPTAADAVLNVQDLEAMLASANTTVTTTGPGVQATNTHVNARLTWTAATTLTLDAFRSIDVNAKVTVAGTGGVSLLTNDGGSGGDFACDNGAITFANLSSALTINGKSYTLINSVASLASALAANPSGAFALANNYNAKKDGTYTTSPIATVFYGSFNGLGNTISNLSINDPASVYYVGFFTEDDGWIANIRLINENVQTDSASYVGGLVGDANGPIAHSLTTGTVSGRVTGGLIGYMSAGLVTRSGSAASVSGQEAGGLVGFANWGSIRDSWATGNVSGDKYIGGLVGGDAEADIKHSWASGPVSGTGTGSTAGGLVGGDSWSIERSYATGAVSCQFVCGGLVGEAQDGGLPIKFSQSFATGTVTGSSGAAGGLVGSIELCNFCEIKNSYALGAVSGEVEGGLVGQNEPVLGRAHAILNSYATGTVNSRGLAGGLIGYDFARKHKGTERSYWDMTTSGITNPSQGAGNIANDPGIKGLSDKKLKSGLPDGFNPKIWKEDSNINGGLPYLINNPPPN